VTPRPRGELVRREASIAVGVHIGEGVRCGKTEHHPTFPYSLGNALGACVDELLLTYDAITVEVEIGEGGGISAHPHTPSTLHPGTPTRAGTARDVRSLELFTSDLAVSIAVEAAEGSAPAHLTGVNHSFRSATIILAGGQILRSSRFGGSPVSA
jgi:hypothetical protein